MSLQNVLQQISNITYPSPRPDPPRHFFFSPGLELLKAGFRAKVNKRNIIQEHVSSSEIHQTYSNRLRLEQRMK